MLTLIFVHGACVRDAAWWWNPMTKPLADRGIASVAVALPSCGETGDELGDLYADVEACRRAIADVDGPVVLCGHSYGGVIITEAGTDDRVTQLLYVTSVMPDAGQSSPTSSALSQRHGCSPAPTAPSASIPTWFEVLPPGLRQDHDRAGPDRLTRQSLTPFTQPPRQIGWRQKPATYFVCTKDLATPAEVQRQRVRANTRVVEFDAGHHPFLARPDTFAQSIAAAVDND